MRFNYICSPEMSMNSTDEEEGSGPHAFVHFEVDDEKAVTPLDFVYRFPVAWRSEGWDKTYLFKTFWSPIPGETPQDLLKRMPEVPCYEKGSSLGKAGYYRASVLAVEESKSSLQNFLDTKRLSVVPIQRKWSSFDKKTNKQVPAAKVSVPPKPKKKKGINKSATRDNLKDEVKDIANQFSFLKNDENLSSQRKSSSFSNTSRFQSISQDNESSISPRSLSGSHEGSNTETSEKSSSNHRPTPSNSSGSPSMNEQALFKVKTEVNKPGSSPATPPRSSSRIRYETTSKKSRSSSTSSSDSSVEVKKVKLDPDFTPVKYVAVKEDLKIAESRLKQVRIINQKLNDNLRASEEWNVALQAEVETLKEKLKDLSQVVYQDMPRKDTNRKKETEKKDQVDRKDDVKEKTNKYQRKETCRQAQGIPNDNYHQNSNDGINLKDTNLTPGKSNANSDTSNLGSSEYDEGLLDASQFCDTEMREAGERNESEAEAVEGYQLLPGVIIPGDVWKLLQNLPKGEKKDIAFIKDLSKYAHGPETLAASTVCGTKKGGRKKDSNEPKDEKKKPGLRKEVLRAVRAELIKRVEREVGKIEDPDSHPRTNAKRYNEAIRGAQKRLKELGFGQGSKGNQDLDIKMLQSY